MKVGKHNHCLTNILKVLIFALVMLQPLIYICVETLPYVFNESFTPQANGIYNYAETLVLSSDLLTWTTNTLLYNGIHTMFTNFNISSNMLEQLLTYWLMMLAIYVVIDIVISVFVYITHIFTKEK